MTDIVQKLRLVDPNQVLFAPPPHDTSYLHAGLLCHQAASEIERLRADAERYRRLKRAFTVTLLDGSVRFGTNYIRAKSIAEIDAAVDAAVKGEKP